MLRFLQGEYTTIMCYAGNKGNKLLSCYIIDVLNFKEMERHLKSERLHRTSLQAENFYFEFRWHCCHLYLISFYHSYLFGQDKSIFCIVSCFLIWNKHWSIIWNKLAPHEVKHFLSFNGIDFCSARSKMVSVTGFLCSALLLALRFPPKK